MRKSSSFDIRGKVHLKKLSRKSGMRRFGRRFLNEFEQGRNEHVQSEQTFKKDNQTQIETTMSSHTCRTMRKWVPTKSLKKESPGHLFHCDR